MTTTDELAARRRQKQLEERRKLLERADRWTPRDTLEAALLDIDLGNVTDVEAVMVVMSVSYMDDGDQYSKVDTYTGTNGATGPKETFWMLGAMMKAISQRLDG